MVGAAGVLAGARSLGRMPVDKVDLILLEALAGTGTVDGAARMAGLVESVARRRLVRLESRLGRTLLTHAAGGAVLTTAGHVLLSAGRRLLSTLAYAVHQVSGPAGGVGADGLQQLRLAVFGRTWDALADDLAVHLPGVLLDLHPAAPEEAIDLYERRSVDAVYAWHGPGEQVNPARPARVYGVVDEPLWVALPAGHRFAADPWVRLRSLADDDWIVAQSPQSRRLVHAACTAAGFLPRLGPAVRCTASARSLIGQGRGVALASPLAVAPVGEAGLVLRPLVDPPRRSHVLAIDPTLGDPVRRILHARLRRAYVAKAEVRNPWYAQSSGFPAAVLGAVDDGATEPDEPRADWPLESAERGGRRDGLAWPGASGPVHDALGIELEDLRVLRVVATCGSLNRAAPILMITQPALSRRIQRLETRLGTALFVRSYRGTRLGPAAHQLLAAIADAEAAFYRTLHAVRERADGAA